MKFFIVFAATMAVAAAIPSYPAVPAAVTYQSQKQTLIPVGQTVQTHISEPAPLLAGPYGHGAPLAAAAPYGHGASLAYGKAPLIAAAPLAHGPAPLDFGGYGGKLALGHGPAPLAYGPGPAAALDDGYGHGPAPLALSGYGKPALTLASAPAYGHGTAALALGKAPLISAPLAHGPAALAHGPAPLAHAAPLAAASLDYGYGKLMLGSGHGPAPFALSGYGKGLAPAAGHLDLAGYGKGY